MVYMIPKMPQDNTHPLDKAFEETDIPIRTASFFLSQRIQITPLEEAKLRRLAYRFHDLYSITMQICNHMTEQSEPILPLQNPQRKQQ